jgi:hypothetical protein
LPKHDSPDGRWLAFHTVAASRERRQVFIAPFRTTNLPIGRGEWIPITDGLGSDGLAAWSLDRPPTANPKLRRLLQTKTPWDQ